MEGRRGEALAGAVPGTGGVRQSLFPSRERPAPFRVLTTRAARLVLCVSVCSAMARFRACKAARLWLLAAWLAAAAGARLEVTRQPKGNTRKGYVLAQQPRVQIVLDDVAELTPSGRGTVNSLGGKIEAPLNRNGMDATSIDVINSNEVVVSFGSNPVGAMFLGRGPRSSIGGTGAVSELRMRLVQGVADFSDIQVTTGGVGFTLVFSVRDSQGNVITAESDPFDCGGQEARLRIAQQPILTVEGATSKMTPPVIHVVDQYGHRLINANTQVTVSMFYSPSGTGFSDKSVTSVQAVAGVATMDAVFLSHACTEIEPEEPEHLHDTKSTKYSLRFQAPGFTDVVSDDFETLPLLNVALQPATDHTRNVSATCSGTFEGCQVFLSNYLQNQTDGKLNKLQTARLYVDVSCTDLDGPDEYVTGVRVGTRTLKSGEEFTPGPWEECAFAGCRHQCATNMRRVVSGLDVKYQIGSDDPVTDLYQSKGEQLAVHVSITDKVNICQCPPHNHPLRMTATLVVTFSQAPDEQGTPMPRQPRISLFNADGSLYILRRKFVAVAFAPGRNPSGALLTGNTRLLSQNGMVQFTDLAISEGGKGYVLRFTVQGVYNSNSTSTIDSVTLNVGCGNFPQLTIECVDCSRPAPSRQEARSLSQPPQLELLRMQEKDGNGGWRVARGTCDSKPEDTSNLKCDRTQSNVEVVMRLGQNGPKGMFSPDTVTKRNAASGSVKFSDTTIYNGNCAFCPKDVCGKGYSLYFIANDVALESNEFNIAGGNRSPRFIHPTPASGTTMSAVMALTRTLLTLNVTDDNHDDIMLKLTSSQNEEGPAMRCLSAEDCLEPGKFNSAPQWGAKYVANGGDPGAFIPQPDDDACSRPLNDASGNGPLEPQDGLYWGLSADVTFTPTCSQASPTYPPEGGGELWVEQTCLRPVDKVRRVDPNIETNGVERCYDVQVMTPAAPFFTRPFRWNHTQASIERIASPSADEAESIFARTQALVFPKAPEPEYIPPHAGDDDVLAAQEGADIKELYVGAGCRIVLPLAAAEVQAGVMSSDALQTKLLVRPFRTTRSSLYGQSIESAAGLPVGARVHQGPAANPHVSSFEWEPARGQEGFVYSVCLQIEVELQSAQTSATLSCSQRFYTAPFHGHAAQYCIDIYVQRCKYCMRAGDSLEGVARAWKTSVAQLWSGNPHLLQPNLLEIGTLLNVGVVYTVDVDDRLPLLAQMAGRSVKDLVAWNPDLPSENQDLLAGDEVLRSAASLYHPGEAPWAGLHGTVANSQAVCVLPDICTFAPLPQSEFVDIEAAKDAVRNATGKISTESFSCSTCRKGSEFCTGAICVEGSNGDPGPWSRDQCKTWRGTRCEQCASCREEEFDVDGHIVVHGTFRRFLSALDRE